MATSEATITKKEYIPVGQAAFRVNKLSPQFQLYYEMHGNGPKRVMFIMGLNQSRLSWTNQLAYFGRVNSGFTALTLDNRGVGDSDGPSSWGLWSVRDMADDALEVLDHVGWTSDVHLVGVSMGGMISLELLTMSPERFTSVTLTSTTAGGSSTPMAGVFGLGKAIFARTPELRLPIVLELIFPKEHLDKPGPAGYKTVREAYLAASKKRASMVRAQPLPWALNQMYAAVRHWISPERLAKIKEAMSPTDKRVLVITGTNDNLVKPTNSFYLADKLQAELKVYAGAGHAVITEKFQEYNQLIEEHFRKAEESKRS